MKKPTIRDTISKAQQQNWDTENVFAVYCTAWAGGPLKAQSDKVQLIGNYDDCRAMVENTPYETMPLSMVELAEGYTLRRNMPA